MIHKCLSPDLDFTDYLIEPLGGSKVYSKSTCVEKAVYDVPSPYIPTNRLVIFYYSLSE